MAPADSLSNDQDRGIPRIASGLDVRSLPIGPEEAFVLSRVDGVSSEADIAEVTNFSAQDVARILSRLAELGAVVFEAKLESVRAAAVRVSSPPMRSGAYRIGPITEMREPRTAAPPAEPDELERALAEAVDLDLPQKRQLLGLYARLDRATHYELLGVDPRADSKAVRAAYYDLVHVLHPDRYFGKNLGSYKPKLAKIFAKLTEAYETLHRAESRADYDKYLHAKHRTLDFERAFFDRERQAAEVASAMQRIEQAARSESLSPSVSADNAVKATSSLPPSSGLARHSLVPPSDADRRRALARKLGHSSAPPPRASSTQQKSASEHAADELKRRYEARLQRAREDQLQHYVALSEEAAKRKDLAAAANALRIACSLAPDDVTLATRLGELENRASAELWEAYAERAKYAAFEGRHAEAAESFERAALGQPSAVHFERAAFHLLEAGGDLKHASTLARQAVALAPQSARCRVTLAQVYYAGKLRESALAELERARVLEPDQPLIKDWIARVKRGD